jgi:hypothetical protein
VGTGVSQQGEYAHLIGWRSFQGEFSLVDWEVEDISLISSEICATISTRKRVLITNFCQLYIGNPVSGSLSLAVSNVSSTQKMIKEILMLNSTFSIKTWHSFGNFKPYTEEALKIFQNQDLYKILTFFASYFNHALFFPFN